jgi:hypothetical protein
MSINRQLNIMQSTGLLIDNQKHYDWSVADLTGASHQLQRISPVAVTEIQPCCTSTHRERTIYI